MGSRRKPKKIVEEPSVVVMVRPSTGRDISWWPVDATSGEYQYASVRLNDHDAFGGYSMGALPDPTCALPPSYVERAKRLWRDAYSGRWVFRVQKVKVPS